MKINLYQIQSFSKKIILNQISFFLINLKSDRILVNDNKAIKTKMITFQLFLFS